MTTLVMHASKPGREMADWSMAMAGNQQTRVSDLVTISYFVAGTATGNLQHAVSGRGLARLEGDRLALSMADHQSNTAALAAKAQILAPEVVALQFAYYDGFRWRYDWDSSVIGGLPKAIQVTMQLTPTPSSQSTSAAANTYRLVIALPLAKPVDSVTVESQQSSSQSSSTTGK